MRLQFDPENEDKYYEVRDTVLDEFESWARRTPGTDNEIGVDAALLLDWRVGYSSGDLSAFTPLDLEEFLLSWCPRKLSAPPETWMSVVTGVDAWLRFLVETGAWSGGLAGPVTAALQDLIPDFLDAMADPTNFGMAKGIFASPALADLEIDPDDPDSLRRAMDAFNALPFEERKASTDEMMTALVGHRRTIDLPTTAAPDIVEAARLAECSPIVEQMRATTEFIGTGLTLTAKGNPKVADARSLLELIPTDDIIDYELGGRTRKLRSADDLPHLMYLIEVAIEAGALRHHRGKLVPVKAFAKRPTIDQVEVMFETMLEIGPIFGRGVAHFHAEEANLLESGLVYWLVPVFVEGSSIFDEIVDLALDVVSSELPQQWRPSDPDRERRSLEREVGKVLDVVERCGLVTRHDAREEADELTGRVYRRGGTLRLTELGRVVLPRYLEEAGYRVQDAGTIGSASAAELLERTGAGSTIDPNEIWAMWWADRTATEKAEAIVEAMGSASSPHARLAGMSLLEQDPVAAATATKLLLATPLAGYAANLLDATNGTVDERAVFESIDASSALAPVVDLLAVEFDDDPSAFPGRFDEVVGDQARETIDLLWRVDLRETVEVLTALGAHHPDKAVAKAARKAAMQHRSRYPS